MPTVALTLEQKRRVLELTDAGFTRKQIMEETGLSDGSIGKIRGQRDTAPVVALQEGKKVGEFKWEEWCDWIDTGQTLRRKASSSQHDAVIKLGDGTKPVILFQLGDTHIGSWGADHRLLRGITKDIHETENLYVVLIGDLIEMAIKMRSVLEVMGQILPPEQQLQFLESWIEAIQDKIAFSCWCNHGVEREEKMTGISSVKNLLAKKSVYFNGIGHPDVQVGEQTYKFVVSHKFRGNSMYSKTYGPARYLRMEAHGREIALQGDLHVPEIRQYTEGGERKLCITSGTLQTASGYAQRYFSLKTFPVFPCVVLRHDRHEAIPFWSVAEALEYIGK